MLSADSNVVLHELALFSGVGMLSEGLRAGLAYLGIKTRTVCHIEREGYAASVLVARMQEGSLDEAPIWSDVCTFDAKRWAGSVDIVVGGFPCTDLSLAGKRAGLDGKRSGLFFNILDIADDCGAQYLFLENVSGIASATASVVDEAEGALDERAAARVLGELADRGWNAEWLTISASEVGASHGRARWLCFAWRQLDNTGRVQRRTGHEQDRPGVAEAGGHQAHHGASDRSGNVADTQCAEWRALSVCGAGGQQGHNGGRPEAHGWAGVADAVLGGTSPCGLFAPGPSDPRWAGIIAAEPWLTPAIDKATESLLCGASDGLAHGLDFSHRAQRLKCVGNGVVPAQAAVAACVLIARAKGFSK